MEEKTKDDSEIITRAIKEMEEAGTLYKADGKPNIPLLMEKTGLTRQRASSLLETTDFNQKMTTDFNQYKCHRIQPISKMQ